MEKVKYQTLPGNISLRIHMTYQPPETTALLQGWWVGGSGGALATTLLQN